MLEWRPEQLPVGSVVIIMGERRTEPHARLLVDLVSRMHERYDECVVFTADAGYWRGTGVRVTGDARDFAALLVPGPPRLVVLDHDDMLERAPRDVRCRCDLTLIVAQPCDLCAVFSFANLCRCGHDLSLRFLNLAKTRPKLPHR